LDSDLANLGRTDFLQQTELLATELQIPIEAMLEDSLALMNRHQWQSPSGNQNLKAQKERNKAILIKMLGRSVKAKLS
jgi:hypothetical protein